MIGKEAGTGKAVPVDEVIDILEERKKSGELTYEQQIALEHSKKFVQGKAHVEKARKAIEALNMLSPKGILKVLEIMPKNAMLLRQILAQEKKAFTDDDVNKILAITKEKS
jgi:DNA-directed RNA polymerase subunit F